MHRNKQKQGEMPGMAEEFDVRTRLLPASSRLFQHCTAESNERKAHSKECCGFKWEDTPAIRSSYRSFTGWDDEII